MKSFIIITIAILLSFTPFISFSQENEALTKEEKNKSSETNQCSRIGGIHQFLLDNKDKYKSMDPTSYSAYKFAFDLVDGIANDTRADQTKMSDFARAINGLLFVLKETDLTREFKDSAFLLTKKLSKQTRRDTLFMNQNISRLIRCDGPHLLEDLAKINNLYLKPNVNEIVIKDMINPFLEHLKDLTNKFINTRQFYVGIGASYAYIPIVRTTTGFDFDLTGFDPTIGNGGMQTLTSSGRTIINSEFSNTSYPALRITADMPLVAVDLMISTKEQTAQSTIPIRAEPTGILNQSVLFKTAITSTLKLDYDIQARLSLRKSLDYVKDWWIGEEDNANHTSFFEGISSQIDFGIGIGTSGFTTKNNISTEYRFKNADNVLYEDLEIQDTITQKSKHAFNVVYYTLFTSFEISDQLMASLEYRFYDDDTSSGNEFVIDGDTLSFSIVYFIF